MPSRAMVVPAIGGRIREDPGGEHGKLIERRHTEARARISSQ